MGKVDRKDDTDEDEDDCSERCDPVAPEMKKSSRMNQEMRMRTSQAETLEPHQLCRNVNGCAQDG